jgi:predicted RNA-binding Zn ribbon-like protein
LRETDGWQELSIKFSGFAQISDPKIDVANGLRLIAFYLQSILLLVIWIAFVYYLSNVILMVIKEMHEKPNRFSFIAGALCLDFVNTVSSHASERPGEKLCVFADLVRWNQEAKLIDKGEALEFLAYSEGNSNSATKILQEARGLREALFRIFRALDRRNTPAAHDLAALNETLRAFPIRLELRSEGRDFCCERKSPKTNNDRLLAPIAWSAADLLASDRVHHVRQCADAECGWFFVDTTKNHSRRWCAMSDCGSHAKAKRYYQRKKKINR